MGMPVQSHGQSQLGLPRQESGKPKYVGNTWAIPPSAQAAWAEVWQAQVVPKRARLQPMQNVDWEV